MNLKVGQIIQTKKSKTKFVVTHVDSKDIIITEVGDQLHQKCVRTMYINRCYESVEEGE